MGAEYAPKTVEGRVLTWAIIAQLAAIIVLRTALNYFLERELRQTEQRRAGQHLDQTRDQAIDRSATQRVGMTANPF